MYHIKSDKRSLQSSQWFFEALEQLMLEKEYSQIKVVDLADKAKLGRTTFYRNFDTIDDVLSMKCDEKFLGLRNYFKEYYKSGIHPNKDFFLKPFLNYWYVNSNSSILELIIKANKLDIIKVSFVNMVNYYRNLVTNTDFVFSNYSNYINEIRSSIAIGILTEWIRNDKDISPDELSDILIFRLKEPINLDLLF